MSAYYLYIDELEKGEKYMHYYAGRILCSSLSELKQMT